MIVGVPDNVKSKMINDADAINWDDESVWMGMLPSEKCASEPPAWPRPIQA